MKLRILVVCLFVSVSLAQEGFRSFTNDQGRRVEARLLSIEQGTAKLEAKGGKTFSVPIRSLSPLDQAYMAGFRDALSRQGEPPVGVANGAAPDKPAAEKSQLLDEAVFDFSSVKFNQKLTPHFDLRSTTSSYQPALKHGEDLFKRLSMVLPGLVTDFEKQQFASPDGQRNRQDFSPSDYRFRFRIYLIHTPQEWASVIQEYAPQLGEGSQNKFLTLTPRTGNFPDFINNRFLAIFVFPERKPESYANLLAHLGAGSMLAGQAQRQSMPLWLKAGLGYWLENEAFQSCVVHYLDFEEYYRGQDGDVSESDTLDNRNSWCKPLRSVCKKGTRYSLLDVINADISEYSPELSGYTFALTSFMLSDATKRGQYQRLIRAMREDDAIAPDEAQVLRAFGYQTHEAFEADWYAYILSNRFK